MVELLGTRAAVQQDGQEDSEPPSVSRHGLHPRLRGVASRLWRRRPLPRTALGVGDLFGGHALLGETGMTIITVETVLTGPDGTTRHRGERLHGHTIHTAQPYISV